MLVSRTMLRVLGAVAVLATASSMAQAQQGRQSLSERVQRLEAQASNGQQNVELLNRITELQAEVQSLRGQLEEQSFKIQELEKRNRDQYVDLDSRIARIESGQAGTGQPLLDPAATPPMTGADPAAPGSADIVMEAPDVRPPVDAGLESSGAAGMLDAPATGETIVDPAAERAAYESAFDSLKNGQYAEAARRFQSFLQQYPSGDYSPNAQYWLGESYYVTQNYQIALDAFQRLLSQFPSSNKAPDALLKVGYCHYELKQWTQAESTLNQVVQQYPDTTVSRLAQGRLRALRLENRQ